MIETKFKDTEVGKIPVDWEITFLDDICEFRNGYTPSKRISAFWTGGTIPWFRMEDIRQNGRILSDAIQHITTTAVKGELFSANTIIMSTTATIGEHALLIADSLANQQFTNFKIRKSLCNKIDIMWFYWYCYKIGEWCRANIHEGGLTAVNIVDLAKLTIPIPPLAEQKRIAEALSNINSLIENLDKLIEKKRLIKQGAMQELLTGKKRLPGFRGDWIEKRLGDIEIRNGSMLKSSEYQKGNIPVIAGGKQPAGFHSQANRGANTITISGSGANAGYVDFHNTPIFASDCSTINEQPLFDNKYLFFSLLLKQNEIYKCQAGGAQPHIHAKDIKDITVLLPIDKIEQHYIASVLSSMDTDIDALEQKRDKYIAIKKGMMQQLLTGKIRLI